MLGLFATIVALVAIAYSVVDRDRRYQALLTDGDRELAAGNAFSAVEAYSGAIALRPDSMAAHLRRGQAYRDEKRDEDAIRDWHQAARLAPQSTQPLEMLGDILSARGDDAQASTFYERSVDLDAADPVKLYKLGLARYRAGLTAAAADPLRRAVALNDNFAEAHYLLGLVLRDTRQPAGAVASLEHAIRLSPGLLPAHEELADLYRSLGRPVDELTQLQALSSLDESLPREVAIALAESRRGDFDGAIGTLKAAAERDANDPQVQLALGRVYLDRAERTMDRRSIADALEALERAMTNTARRGESVMLLGRALYLSGDDAGAERLLREAVSTTPLMTEAFGYLADATERQREFEAARESLEKLDALQGDTAPPGVRAARARRLGLLSLKVGDAASAIEFLTQALDGGVGDASVFGALADAEFQSGDVAAARSALAKALALAPTDPDLLRLQRQIR